jgi:hypothetical protein
MHSEESGAMTKSYDDAAARREADLKAAADSLEASRAAEDEARAQARLDEDTALADARREEDRVVASARGRVSAAAVALQSAVDRVATGEDPEAVADLRVANDEMQAAVQGHMAIVPEQPAEQRDRSLYQKPLPSGKGAKHMPRTWIGVGVLIIVILIILFLLGVI